MDEDSYRRKVAEIEFIKADKKREQERLKKRSEIPLFSEYLFAIGAIVFMWLWKGEEMAIPLAFIASIVIIAVPIKRKIRREWPDWFDSTWTKPLEKFQYTVALGISSALVYFVYTFIIEPLTN